MKIAFLGDSITASANVNLTDRWACLQLNGATVTRLDRVKAAL